MIYDADKLKASLEKNGLTEVTRYKILSFIVDYTNRQYYPPSIREICQEVGRYPSSIQGALAALEREGWIKRGKGAREIRVLRIEAETSTGAPVARNSN